MSNTIDSTWVTDSAFTNYGKGTDIYFKVYAVGQNNDTTESYRYQYQVRTGQNINSVIENNFEYDVNLYPNPNSGQFYIDLGNQYNDVDIEIFDALGKRVYHSKDSGNDLKVNFNGSKGNYILSISSDDKKAKIQFVLE